MFSATKLRRGMIPKDKEARMLNLEPWGKGHVSPLFCSPSLVSSNHHLSYSIVSWGSCWLAGKPLLHPHLLSLSTTCLLVADGLSTIGMESLFVFPHAGQS